MEIERKWMVAGWPEQSAPFHSASEAVPQPARQRAAKSNDSPLPLLYTEYQEQGYLHTQAPIVRVRMEERHAENGTAAHTQYILCFKSAGLLSREEIEIKIGKEDFQRLAGLAGKPLIRKERRVYRLPGDLALEVNLVDKGLPSEFMYAEVEFSSEAQARSFDPASIGLGDYLADDVTEKPGQSMSAYWARTRNA